MTDRVALVTGGSGGIGAATCRALAAAGARVLVGYRSDPGAAVAIADDCDGQAEPVLVDVTDEDTIAAAVERAGQIGELGILVNSAGVLEDDLVLRLDTERWDRTMEINLRGVFVTTRAALRPMLRGRYGRIITVASVVGLRGNAGQAAYAASKAGVVGFTRSLAREVARKGITVNAVAPGYVETTMTGALPARARQALIDLAPTGRPVTCEEVAAAIRFLASEEATGITGAVLPVDGGATA